MTAPTIPATPPLLKSRIYVGVDGASRRRVFRSVDTPTRDSCIFAAVIGPFRTLRGARFMAEQGGGNPHCQCVADAERIAARQVSQ